MKRALTAILLLLAATCGALAQSAPANLPYHTVYGRLGAVPGLSGPGEAIPFATLRNQIIPFAFPLYADDYGCKGDGVTNDTNCIKNVIRAANGTREVVLSGKTYCIDPIKIGDGGLPVPPRIGGVAGYVTDLIACGTSAFPTVTYSNFSFDTASSVHDLRIQALGLHANGLLIHGCQYCSFERIRVQGAGIYGIVVHGEPGYNVQYNSFRDMLSRGNGGGGWKFLSTNNAGDYYVAANHCSGLRAQSNLGDGVNIDYATVDCNGAELEANTGYGLNVDHTKGGVWNPVHIEGNTAGGIKVTANTTNLHFQGGRIDQIDPLLLANPTSTINQTDGAGQNDGFLRPTSIAVGTTATDQGAGTINLGGGSLFNNGVAPTGTGAYVRAISPTVSGLQVTGSFTAAGLVTNADLANPATTVNGQTCTLGSTCTVTAAASSVAIGTTTITSGTTTRVLYDNAGVLGEYTGNQLTALINPATAVLSGALPAWPNNTTTFFRGDGSYAAVALSGLSGLGTGIATALAINTGSAGAPVLFNGAGGTPSSLTLTNATGLPTTGLTGTLQAAQEPAHTGDVTNTAGSLALAIGATKVTSAMLNADVFSTAHTWAGQQTFVAPILGTPASGVATNLTGTASGLTAGNVTTNANLTGDVTSVGNATTLTNAPVIAKVLTGFASGAGTVSAADSILTALQKIDGNVALKAPLASPTLTGTPVAPTAAVDTNTTQIATTAMVLAQAAAATPLGDGTAAVGTSTRYARADHVHPIPTQFGVMSVTLTGVDFSVAGDKAIAFTLPPGMTRMVPWRVDILHASADISGATFGMFSATAAGGVVLLAAGTSPGVTTASDATVGNAVSLNLAQTAAFVAASLPTANTVYFRVGTTAAAGRTGDVVFSYFPRQ